MSIGIHTREMERTHRDMEEERTGVGGSLEGRSWQAVLSKRFPHMFPDHARVWQGLSTGVVMETPMEPLAKSAARSGAAAGDDAGKAGGAVAVFNGNGAGHVLAAHQAVAEEGGGSTGVGGSPHSPPPIPPRQGQIVAQDALARVPAAADGVGGGGDRSGELAVEKRDEFLDVNSPVKLNGRRVVLL